MKAMTLLFAVIGVILSIWLTVILVWVAPYDSFSEQGAALMDMIWGRISLLDLYAGFFMAIALVWLLEPTPWIRWSVTLTLPVLGNPILAIWLVARLKRLATLQSTT